MAAAANRKENREQGISAENLFPLDAPEPIVRLERKGRIFRHIFRRLTASDLEAFYGSIDTEVTVEDRCGSQTVCTDTAALVLYERAIQRVEGYRTRDGREPEKLPSWPHCIPLFHRLHATGLLLKNRGRVTADTLNLGADGASVSFLVDRVEGESSAMTQRFGVIHRFRAPTADHCERFLSAVNEFPSSARGLFFLYDELAACADGYSYGSLPVAPEQLPRVMDAYHKLLAISALLTPFEGSDSDPRVAKAIAVAADLFGMEKTTRATRGEVN